MYNTISPKSKRWGKEMIFVVNCFMEINSMPLESLFYLSLNGAMM